MSILREESLPEHPDNVMSIAARTKSGFVILLIILIESSSVVRSCGFVYAKIAIIFNLFVR